MLTNKCHSLTTLILIAIFSLFCTILVTKQANSASLNIENFSNDYQYQYIDDHIESKNNHITLQLKKTLSNANLSPTAAYFINHNLAYTLFKQHNKNAALKQINQTIATLQANITNNPLAFDSYHLGKSLLLRAKTLGILFRATKKAIPDLENAISANKLSNHVNKTQLLFDLQTAMAQAYNQLGKLTQAKRIISQALATAKLLKNKNETIYALIISGRIAFQQEQFTLAYQEYLKALQLSDESTPKKRIASIELRLAIAYEAQNFYEQALIHAKKAVNLYDQLSEERLQIKSLRVLGNIYLSLGQDIDSALVHFINGLTIAKTIKDPYSIGQMQHLIGKAYLLENNIELAQKYLYAAQNILNKSKEWFYLGLNTIELAKLSQHKNNAVQAIKLMNNFHKDKNYQPYPALLTEANNYLVSLYVAQKDFKKAYFLQNQLTRHNNNKQNINTTKLNTKNNTQKFNKAVELKMLKEKSLKQKSALKNAQYESVLLNKKIKNYLIILIITVLAFIISYIQARKWHKRYKSRLVSSILSWRAFKEKVMTQTSTMKAKGILLVHSQALLPHYFSANSNECAQKNMTDTPSDKVFVDIKLSDNIAQYNNFLWILCNQSYNETQKKLLSIQEKNTEKLYFIWIDLADFPPNISIQALSLIELLSHYLLETERLSKVINTNKNNNTYYQILIQAQALPLIFTLSNNKNDIALGLEKAFQQGLITLITID